MSYLDSQLNPPNCPSESLNISLASQQLHRNTMHIQVYLYIMSKF